MEVSIINNSIEKIDKEALIEWVKQVCNELKSNNNISALELDKSLTVVFVDKKEIKRLNTAFRKKESVTDILSFAPLEENSLGELVVCLSVVFSKKIDGFSETQWLYYLLIHGILHLLGFEHEHEKEEDSSNLMYQIQDEAFEKLMLTNKAKRKVLL